jgi:transcription elongation factor Elf1
MLTDADVEGLRWVQIARVSSRSQRRNHSLDDQLQQHQSTRNRLNGELVKTFEVAESATTLDRETINETLEMAKNDEFDILGIHRIDRLTRADPWDAIELLKEYSDHDIILYENVHGPYDWNDFNDFRRLVNEVVFSRQNVLAIKDGQKRGYRGPLEDNEWPFGPNPPAAIKLDSDKQLQLKSGARKVVPEIFNYYLKSTNISATEDYINDNILPEGEIESLSYGQVRNILSNNIFVGNFRYMGELFGRNPKFRLVSKYKFEKVQEIRSGNSESEDSHDRDLEVLSKLEAFSERFGPHTLLNVLPFEPICEECGSVMDWDNDQTGTAKGLDVPKFECPDCGHSRNIPNSSDLDHIHQTLPLRCPYCVGADEFTVKDDLKDISRYDYEYTCEVCGRSWGSNITPQNYLRYIQNHEIGFTLNDETSKDETDADIDPQQKTLT